MVPDSKELVSELFSCLDEYREQYKLGADDYYWQKLAKANRFDPAEIIFFKRMLLGDFSIFV